MRHYHRESYRHLNDSARYRDHEYLADDRWVGPNEQERALRGSMSRDEGRDQAPWSARGDSGAEAGLHGDGAFDARRGARGGAWEGAHLGDLDLDRFGLGRPETPHARSSSGAHERGHGRPRGARPRSRGTMRDAALDAAQLVRRPGALVKRIVRGIFHGKGPKNWIRSDARIHDEICEVLADHPAIDASEIEVTVKDCEVTLSGAVPDRRTKRLAEAALDGVAGVVDVHNRLRVGATTA